MPLPCDGRLKWILLDDPMTPTTDSCKMPSTSNENSVSPPPTHSHSAQNQKKALNAGYLSFSNRKQWKETDRLGHKPSALSGSGCWLLRLREQREREGPLRPEWTRLTRPIQNRDSFVEQKIVVTSVSCRSGVTPIAQVQLSVWLRHCANRRAGVWDDNLQGSLKIIWRRTKLLILK